MFVILFIGLVASCAAAPRFQPVSPPCHHQPSPNGPSHQNRYDLFSGNIFDATQFWGELANELHQLDTKLAQLPIKFPAVSSTEGVRGDEYKITIPLNGFVEKDIVVKARKGLMVVQAVHNTKEGETNSYLEVKSLPTFVNVTGSWKFENDVLKVVFPLNQDTQTENADVTEAPALENSREDMDTSRFNTESGLDADVGLQDQDKDREILTNEIPRNTVEATTYPVDFKDEVELVPMRY